MREVANSAVTDHVVIMTDTTEALAVAQAHKISNRVRTEPKVATVIRTPKVMEVHLVPEDVVVADHQNVTSVVIFVEEAVEVQAGKIETTMAR